MKKSYSSAFKSKVSLEMLRERETTAVISSRYQVPRSVLSRWKQEALLGLKDIFKKDNKTRKEFQDPLIDELYKQIGKLRVENEWLKKSLEKL